MTSPIEAPQLGDWITIAEAAEILGITRQNAWKLAGRGKFRSVHKIGSKKFFVISRAEVEEYKEAREAVRSERGEDHG